MAIKQALVFPGQSSQFIGMATDLVKSVPRAKKYFDKASNILGYDLFEVCEHDDKKINETKITQPAIFVVSYLSFLFYKSDTSVSMLAGHSLGELSALACSGFYGFEDGIRIVAERGRLMDEFIPFEGGMLAIKDVSIEQLIEIQELNSYEFEIANINSKSQIIVSGPKEELLKMKEYLISINKKSMMLPVKIPFHSKWMQKAAFKFEDFLLAFNFREGSIPVYCSHKNDFYQVSMLPLYLGEQIINKVNWIQTIETLKSYDIESIIEMKPNNVLTNLSPNLIQPVNQTMLSIAR